MFDVLLIVVYVQLRGEFVRVVGSMGAGIGQFNGPYGMALSPDETRLLVVDHYNARVVVADARDGRSLRLLQGPAGTLVQPYGVAMVARTGQVLVLDWQRHLVVVFAGVDDDTVVRTLGDGYGDGPRQLRWPQAVAVLDEGDAADRPVAVVADTLNHRLSLFRVDDDTLLRHVGSRGAAPGQFENPSEVYCGGVVGGDGERRGVAGGGRFSQSSRASADVVGCGGARAGGGRWCRTIAQSVGWRDGVCRDGRGSGVGLA